MPRTLRLNRDGYGNVKDATFAPREPHRDDFLRQDIPGVKRYEKRRTIKSYKDLVHAMCQSPCSNDMFNAAWRRAGEYGGLAQPVRLADMDDAAIETAKSDAEIVENIMGDLVNDPDSRFHIYG